ncbi:MAG: hypothetical protein KF857_05185 [Fimbriimonadaceae bacterium]|nr:hypothetical protein [Fimbriimonadaceae bacterium]
MTTVMVLAIAIGLPMVIALVAILTEHQRKMAEIINRNGANGRALEQMSAEIVGLRAELARTKDLVNQQVLAEDAASPTRKDGT